MDKKLILSRPEALELYCSLIYTFENIKIENKAKEMYSPAFTSFKGMDYKSEKFLKNAFGKYRTESLTCDINKAITGDEKSKKFYYFSNRVRFHEQIHVSKPELNLYIRYLRNNDQFLSTDAIDRLEENIRLGLIEKSELKLPTKIYSLANTEWALYYWDEKEAKPGITRSILSLGHFCRATIVDYNAKMNRHDFYKGEYEIYDKNFLKVSLRLAPEKTKDLEISCYLGNSETINFLLGQYHDISARIYSGNIVLQKLQNKVSADVITSHVKFFPAEFETEEISAGIKNFLSSKQNNFISIRDIIVAEPTFEHGRG